MLSVHRIETSTDQESAFSIRREVFIQGQKVPEQIELDEYDASANHVLALVDAKPAGTARWRDTADGIKLERFAVLDAFQRRGVGSALVTFVLQELPLAECVFLNAQIEVIDFYSRHGFVAMGPVFYEAGIPHRRMELGRDS